MELSIPDLIYNLLSGGSNPVVTQVTDNVKVLSQIYHRSLVQIRHKPMTNLLTLTLIAALIIESIMNSMKGFHQNLRNMDIFKNCM